MGTHVTVSFFTKLAPLLESKGDVGTTHIYRLVMECPSHPVWDPRLKDNLAPKGFIFTKSIACKGQTASHLTPKANCVSAREDKIPNSLNQPHKEANPPSLCCNKNSAEFTLKANCVSFDRASGC